MSDYITLIESVEYILVENRFDYILTHYGSKLESKWNPKLEPIQN
jgi:hypothetical protein